MNAARLVKAEDLEKFRDRVENISNTLSFCLESMKRLLDDIENYNSKNTTAQIKHDFGTGEIFGG